MQWMSAKERRSSRTGAAQAGESATVLPNELHPQGAQDDVAGAGGAIDYCAGACRRL